MSELAQIDPGSLGRTDDLSRDINFEEAVPFLTAMLEVISELNQRSLERLPSQQLDKINRSCQTLSGLIQRVESFDLNQNTPGDVCTSIIIDIQNAYDGFMDPLLPALTFTATQATDYSRIEREAKGHHQTIKNRAAEFEQFLENNKKEAATAMAALRALVAESGVSQNAEHYSLAAEENKNSAKSWLWATSVLAVITLLVAAWFLKNSLSYTPSTVAESIQYVSSKVLLLTVLFSALYWAGKNYRAYKHNQTLNSHRKVALQTFRTFVEGTSDERVKDAILLHAAQAAFGSRSTGFDGGDSEAGPVHPIVEVLGRAIQQRPSASNAD